MTLKEALEKSNTEPKRAMLSDWYEWACGDMVPIDFAIQDGWKPVILPFITPQAGDLWKLDSGKDGLWYNAFCHWRGDGLGILTMTAPGGIQHDDPKTIEHGKGGWKLEYRDGKPWVENQ